MSKYMHEVQYRISTSFDKSGIDSLRGELKSLQNSVLSNPSRAYTKESRQKDLQNIELVTRALNNSFNPRTGLIGLTTFNQTLQKSGSNLKDLSNEFDRMGSGGRAAFTNLITQLGTYREGIKQTQSATEKIAQTFGNTVRWGLVASVFQQMTSSLSQSVQYMKSLDDSLTNITMVSGQSRDSMKEFAAYANQAAASLGSSTTNFTNATKVFIQEGFSLSEAKKQAEQAVILANVSEQDTATTADQITSYRNAFNLDTEDVNTSLDKFANIANRTASNVGELMTAAQRSASTARAVGTSEDSFLASIATIQSITRESAENIGNGLKSIYTRFADIKMGGSTEEGVDLGKYANTLKAAGVNVLDESGQYRGMEAILSDLQNVWDTLGETQKVAVGETVAGRYQYNRFATLMNNKDYYDKAYSASVNSAGAMEAMQSKYMDGINAQMQKAATNIEALFTSVYNSGLFEDVVKSISALSSVLRELFDNIDGSLPIVTALATAILKIGGKNIAAGVINMQENRAAKEQTRKNIEDTISNNMAAQYGTLWTKNKRSERVQGFLDNNVTLIQNQGKLTQDQRDYNADIANKAGIVVMEDVNARQKLNETMMKTTSILDTLGVKNISLGGTEESLTADVVELTSALSELIRTENLQPETSEKVSDNAKKLSAKYSTLNKYIQEMEESFSSSSESGVINKKKNNWKKNLKLTLIGNIDKIRQAGALTEEEDIALKNLEKTIKKTGVTWEELNGAIQEFRVAAQPGITTMEALGEHSNGFIGVLRVLQRQLKELVNDCEEARVALDAIDQLLGEAADRTKRQANLTDKINIASGAAGALMNLQMAIGSFRDLTETMNEFNEGTIGSGEFFDSLMVDIPMAATSLGAMGLEIKNIISIVGELEEGWKGLFKSILTGLKQFGPYIILIGAAVAVTWKLWESFHALDIAVEKANEKLEKAKNAFNQISEAAKETRKNIEQYNTLSDTLDSLEVGTDAWNEKLQESNTLVLDLLNLFPELAKYIENVNGRLVIDTEGLDKVEDELNKQETAAKAGRLEAESEVDTAENNKEKEKMTKNLESSGVSLKGRDLENLSWIMENYGAAAFSSEEALRKAYEYLYKEKYDTDMSVGDMPQAFKDSIKGFVNNSDVIVDTLTPQVESKRNNTQAQELTMGEALSDNDVYSKSQNKDELNRLVTREMQGTLNKFKNTYSGESDENVKNLYAQKFNYEKKDGKWINKITGEDGTDLFSGDIDVLRESLAYKDLYDSKEFKSFSGNLGSYDTAISAAKAAGVDSTLVQFGEFKDKGYINGISLSKELINKIGAEIGSDGKVALDKDAKEALKSMFTEEMAQAYGIDLEELKKSIDGENMEFSLADQTNEIKRISNAFVEAQGTAWADMTSEQQEAFAKEAGVTVEAINDQADVYQKQAMEGKNSQQDINDLAEEVKKLDKARKDESNTAEEAAAAEEKYQKALNNLSRATKEQARDNIALKTGFDEISKSIEDSWESLKRGDTKAVSEVRDSLAKAFQIDSEDLDLDFVTDNLDLIKKAAKGDEAAFNKLSDAIDGIRTDKLIEVLNLSGAEEKAVQDINDYFNSVEFRTEVKVGATIEDNSFNEAVQALFNKALEDGKLAMEELEAITDMMASNGVEIDWESTVIPMGASISYKEGKPVSFKMPAYDPEGGFPITETHDISTLEAQTETIKAIGPAKIKWKKTGNVGSGNIKLNDTPYKPTKSDKGGGGGGGKGGKKKDPIKKSENNRNKTGYSRLSKTMDKMSNTISRLNEQSETLWGKKRLDSIKDINEATKKYISTLKKQGQEQLKQINYNKTHKTSENDLDTIAKYGLKTDSSGYITNASYTKKEAELYKKMEDARKKYNKKRTEKNEEAYKKLQEDYKNFQDVISKHTESVDAWYETQNQIIEQAKSLNELRQKELEHINEINDAFTSLQDVINDLKTNSEKASAILGTEFEKASQQLSTALRNNETAFGTMDYFTKGGKWVNKTRYDKAIEDSKYWNNQRTIYDQYLSSIGKEIAYLNSKSELSIKEQEKLANLQLKFANTAEKVGFDFSSQAAWTQKLGDYTSNLSQISNDMYSSIEELQDAISGYINSITDQMDSFISNYENIGDILSTLVSIASDYSGLLKENKYGITNDILEKQLKSSQAQLELSKDNYIKIKDISDRDIEDASIKKALDEKTTEFQKQILEKTTDVLEVLNQILENSMNQSIDNMSTSLFGEADLDWLSTQQDWNDKITEGYYDDVERVYEIQKLSLSYQNLINDANKTSSSLQKKISEQMNSQMSILEQKTELSEYDVKYAESQLEILKAQIALEDAQNAKNKLQLQRDAQGNYKYIYTSDSNKISEAQKKLLEAQQNAYALSKSNLENLNKQTLEIYKNYLDEVKNINSNQALDYEEKKARIEELTKKYQEAMNRISSATSDTYDNIMRDISGVDTSIIDKSIKDSDFVKLVKSIGTNDFGELLGKQIDVAFIDKIMDKSLWESAANSFVEDILDAMKQYQEVADGLGLDKLISDNLTSVTEEMTSLQGEISLFNKNFKEMVGNIVEAFRELKSSIDKFKKINGTLELVADKNGNTFKIEMASAKTGAYTGTFGPGEKIMGVHEKELILNAADTANILSAVDLVRQMKYSANSKNALSSIFEAAASNALNQGVEQRVEITANFPNATDANDIRQAILSLADNAYQYVNRSY